MTSLQLASRHHVSNAKVGRFLSFWHMYLIIHWLLLPSAHHHIPPWQICIVGFYTLVVRDFPHMCLTLFPRVRNPLLIFRGNLFIHYNVHQADAFPIFIIRAGCVMGACTYTHKKMQRSYEQRAAGTFFFNFLMLVTGVLNSHKTCSICAWHRNPIFWVSNVTWHPTLAWAGCRHESPRVGVDLSSAFDTLLKSGILQVFLKNSWIEQGRGEYFAHLHGSVWNSRHA